MIQTLIKLLQPEQQPNSKQTADNISVSPSIANAVLAAVILGKDASNQDIIPIRSQLVVKTNAHPNCDGTRWGWIEGCSKNIVWSNENNKFNKDKADELVSQYNKIKKLIICSSAEQRFFSPNKNSKIFKSI
jgi:hypothetical protein